MALSSVRNPRIASLLKRHPTMEGQTREPACAKWCKTVRYRDSNLTSEQPLLVAFTFGVVSIVQPEVLRSNVGLAYREQVFHYRSCWLELRATNQSSLTDKRCPSGRTISHAALPAFLQVCPITRPTTACMMHAHVAGSL